MKAQATIIQFIIFFILGLVIFATIGSFFKYQSDLLKGQVTSSSLQLVNDYVTTLAVMEYDTCKKCDFASMTMKISNTTADYLVQIKLDPNSLSVVTQPSSASAISLLANLYYSMSFVPSSAFSTQGITLTYDKNKNSIVVQ